MDDCLIEIDPDACVGYGECVAEDSAAVELDEHGCARMLVARLTLDRARRLCEACPAAAIRIAADAG
jgi:ferredoxin